MWYVSPVPRWHALHEPSRGISVRITSGVLPRSISARSGKAGSQSVRSDQEGADLVRGDPANVAAKVTEHDDGTDRGPRLAFALEDRARHGELGASGAGSGVADEAWLARAMKGAAGDAGDLGAEVGDGVVVGGVDAGGDRERGEHEHDGE